MRFGLSLALLMLAACGFDENLIDPQPIGPKDAGSHVPPAPEEDGGEDADTGAEEPRDASAGHDGGHVTLDAGSPDAGDAAVVDAGTDAGAGAEDAGDDAPVPCTKTKYYRDEDADGFGTSEFVESCEAVAPHTALVAGDCYDSNASAKPGQAAYFMKHRGDGSFDYDCDGVATKIYTEFANCPALEGNTCPPPNYWPSGFSCDHETVRAAVEADDVVNGWYAATIPVCGLLQHWGAAAVWIVEQSSYRCVGNHQGISRYQRCR